MVRGPASEEGWPLADIGALKTAFGMSFSILELNLLPAVLPQSLSLTLSLMRRVLEMDLKPWVPAPSLPLMLCDSALCGCQERLFITLVTLSLAMGISLACSGLSAGFPLEEDPYL